MEPEEGRWSLRRASGSLGKPQEAANAINVGLILTIHYVESDEKSGTPAVRLNQN